MKARIRRISASVDTAISFGSTSSSDACINVTDLNSSTEITHGYNPSSKSLDICVPESRIEKMRKLLSSPLLRRRNASQHGTLCSNHCHHKQQQQQHQPSSSSSSSPSSSPALGSSSNSSMKTFGVSLESLSHHQHPHHQQHHPEEYLVRDTEQVVVPHQKAAHILGQVCPGCLTSAPSNSSSTGSINDSSGHFSHQASSHEEYPSMPFAMVASPSSGNSSSSTTSSASSTGGPGQAPCLIPFIVTRLCNYIENSGGMVQEGLFRVSGNAKLVEKLKQSFDLTGDAALETEGDLSSAAALLKQFLRELPQPLIPNGSQFLDVVRSLKNDHETCVLSLKALVSQLPDENYFTLRYLIRFLHRIAQQNEENRMTSSNLGIVFAPNIFRVCVDTYQGLKDQSSANEVVNLLITEYGDIFNEIGDGCCNSTGCGGGSSREDLSSAISCDSESSCPFTCSHTAVDNCLHGILSPELNNESSKTTILLSDDDSLLGVKLDSDARQQLDRKRKEYQNKNHHRTIDEFFEDERCQSFDCGQNLCPVPKPAPPQRCNSVGNNADEVMASTIEHPKSEDICLKPMTAHFQPQEIIITNSSDSVSTDDNTTTTATSTGATVCSVVVGENPNVDNSDDNITDIISDKKLLTSGSKLLNCENISPEQSHMKTGRSGSCGSDCTENINIPVSLNFFSEDDDEDDEDSLSKSIASECSNSGSNTSESTSSSRCNSSGNEGDSSSGNQSDVKNQSAEPMAQYRLPKPWIRDQNSDEEPPQLSERRISNEQEALKSPSAFRRHLDNNNNNNSPPLSSHNNDFEQQQPNKEGEARDNASIELEKSIKLPGLKSRNRRLNSIRRKLKQFEVDFEQENGFRASYEHKMASSFARPLMIELSSLLNVGTRNLKEIDNKNFFSFDEMDKRNQYYDSMTDSTDEVFVLTRTTKLNGSWKYGELSSVPTFTTEDIFYTIFGNPKEKSLAKINEMMEEIQRSLAEKRVSVGRPESLDAMTSEQIFDEKLALQKALLRFEALYGRPNSKAERDIVRPVYDRYRLVKRYAAKTLQKANSKDVNAELQPIFEHVQMDFTSPTHQPKADSGVSVVKESKQNNGQSNPTNSTTTTTITDQPPEATPSDRNFHEMSRDDLVAHLHKLRQQKRNLRSVLRTFENDFYKKTGRRVEKEDRCNMSSVYNSYKNTKGKIRLLDALVSKYETQKCPN